MKELNVYEKEWADLYAAKAMGWPGQVPGVLGHYTADLAVAEARRWLAELREKEGSKP